MKLPRPSPRPLVQEGARQSMPLETTDTLGTGPANEMIARLADAIAQEQDSNAQAKRDHRQTRRPLPRSLTLLVVGCGLFWLLVFAAIVAFA